MTAPIFAERDTIFPGADCRSDRAGSGERGDAKADGGATGEGGGVRERRVIDGLTATRPKLRQRIGNTFQEADL